MKPDAKPKLVLGRETLQRLDRGALGGVRGGAGGDPRTSKPTGNGKPPTRNTNETKDDPSCYIGPCCNG